MENFNASKSTTISLPAHLLDWSLVKKPKNLVKIIFQFEVEMSAANDKVFSLVAYPVYKGKKEWKMGKRIPLSINKDVEPGELPLPLTLGNLELDSKKIRSLIKSCKKTLFFKPYLYDKNPHAAYMVMDERGQNAVSANPCPPGRPSS